MDAGAVDASNVSDATTQDALPPIDAGEFADAFQSQAWDIAYVNGISSTGGFSWDMFARVVNTSSSPLDLSGFEILAVSHDAPAGASVTFELGMTPLDGVIPPGQAAGAIGGEPAFYIDPLVPETVADDTSDLLRVTASGLALGSPDFTINAIVGLGGRQATLLINVHTSPAFTTVTSAERVSSTP